VTEEKFCSWSRNELTDNAKTTFSGSAFQIIPAATVKAIPIADRFRNRYVYQWRKTRQILLIYDHSDEVRVVSYFNHPAVL